MNFAQNLKKYREAAGYKTAKEFAAALGIGYTTYVGYENKGYEPNYETLCAIARKLNISLDDLVGNTPPPTIERYLQILREAGFTVEKDPERNGYNVDAPQDVDAIFFFDEEPFLTESGLIYWVDTTDKQMAKKTARDFREALTTNFCSATIWDIQHRNKK